MSSHRSDYIPNRRLISSRKCRPTSTWLLCTAIIAVWTFHFTYKRDEAEILADDGQIIERYQPSPAIREVHSIPVNDKGPEVGSPDVKLVKTSSPLKPTENVPAAALVADSFPASPEPTKLKADCERLMNQTGPYEKGRKEMVRVIAAAPGSGSDWIYYSLPMATGYKSGTVYRERTNFKVFYWKTHYPYMSWKDNSISRNAKKAILLIRHPLNAAYSEYFRMLIEKRQWKFGGYKGKYANFEKMIHQEDLVVNGTTSPALKNHITKFIASWKNMNEYWLAKYGGEVRVFLYQDLLKNHTLFKDIIDFFDSDALKSQLGSERFDCYLDHMKMERKWKRPDYPVVERNRPIIFSEYSLISDQTAVVAEDMILKKIGVKVNLDQV